MNPLKVYIGWDKRDLLAFQVCVKSLRERATIPTEIVPLQEWKLRDQGCYWRPYRVDEKGQMWDDRDGKPFSTDFSFSRFCVPWLADYKDEWVLFCDPDMLWLEDVAELLKLRDESKAVMCVQHNHRPKEVLKMNGVMQTVYDRKNWSSLMLINPARCQRLTAYTVNNQTGSWLHAMCWADDDEIGGLPESWNWLEGWTSPDIKPNVIHYTRGTPDMDPNVQHADLWWSVAAET